MPESAEEAAVKLSRLEVASQLLPIVSGVSVPAFHGGQSNPSGMLTAGGLTICECLKGDNTNTACSHRRGQGIRG